MNWFPHDRDSVMKELKNELAEWKQALINNKHLKKAIQEYNTWKYIQFYK